MLIANRLPTSRFRQSIARTLSLVFAGIVTVMALSPAGLGHAATNPYAGGGCTDWVWQKRPDLPGGLGAPNAAAANFATNAAAKGFPVGASPQPGAVAVFPPGTFKAVDYSRKTDSVRGHVAYVESVDPAKGTFRTSNWWKPGGPTDYVTFKNDSRIRFIYRKSDAPPPPASGGRFDRFILQTGSALGLDDPTKWEFVGADVNRDGIQDLIGIIEIGPTGTGRKEVHVLNGATNFTSFLLQTGIPLGLDDPNKWEFEAGDVNRDGRTDLIGIVEQGPTGTQRKEMHVLSGATNFQTFILQVGLPLGLDDPNKWEFVAGDQNRDGYVDLIGVIEVGPTGTNRKEVHVLNGATSFQSFLYQAGLPLGLDDFMKWEFQGADVNRDGSTDLVGIIERGPTGTNRREIHVLDGASGFQRFIVQQGTAIGLDDPTNWEFEMGDINRDGVPDLIGILERGPTGTNRREVHVMG